jgi:hypothetical protein
MPTALQELVLSRLRPRANEIITHGLPIDGFKCCVRVCEQDVG